MPTRWCSGYLWREGPPGAGDGLRSRPLLLARLLNLNEVQSGVLNIIFRIADDRGLLLLDFKDLRAITQFIGE
ncbi:nucleotide triphosphate hydrolase domain-containing protein [Klebsiella pneumoniae]|uniref:Nucleotide triphosphate hydrolase domain-containing protein n=1 Tax=Klebsiella pneumoniae TaxID=573 RepID=A0A377WC29_KLEPN|nr:nucleotide triphosphate hydrolase domain-containing protein [Klebsiella pneumoniae]